MNQLSDRLATAPVIGVLALQGDFNCHLESLKKVGATGREVRSLESLHNLDALILPGGESTTMALLLREFNMWTGLKKFTKTKPVWGTCAGLILLSSQVEDGTGAPDKTFEPLGVLDVTVSRNAYGRQINSFEDKVEIIDGAEKLSAPVSFIRAPKITRVGSKVEVLAKTDDTPTLVRQGNLLGSAFHTELHEDTTFIRYFLNHVSKTLSADKGESITNTNSRSREVA